jgi:hypothetical protein
MIVPPIVLEDRDGHLGVFESADEAIANVDLDDVLDREFIAYDSRGALLSVERGNQAGRVATLVALEDPPRHDAQLRAALLRALRLGGIDTASIADDVPLPRLLEEARRRKRGYWLP